MKVRSARRGARGPGRGLARALIAASVGLGALTSGALAQPRPSTVAMPCGQARALVARHGAIVLGTGGYTYDRYVLHRGFCYPTQTTKPAWVPALDTPQCFVGYTCVEPDPWFDW